MSSYVIGDVHGCADTFERLIENIPSDAKIYATGDLIDRGPDSRKVISICIERGVEPVMGNHEHMLLDFLDCTSIYPKGLYFLNGGRTTIKEYNFQFEDVAPDHLEYIRALPLYIETEHFILSHAGVHFMKDMTEACDISEENEHNILWNRAGLADLGKLQVVGHTPARDVRQMKNGNKIVAMNIDTGAYSPYYGRLTAVSFPEKQIMHIPCIDPLGWHGGHI